MFEITKDNSIYVTRGDILYFGLTAQDDVTKEALMFQPGDIIRMKVYGKKNCKKVVMKKDFLVETPTEEVAIYLDNEDTTIGDIINKNTTYWYSIERNPGIRRETLIGNDKGGAKLFMLCPEGAELPVTDEEITTEDLPVVDKELDALSERPVSNSAVARAYLYLLDEIKNIKISLNIKEGE